MSIHVCECERNGKKEFHLRYPGWTKDKVQHIANILNTMSDKDIDAILNRKAPSLSMQPVNNTI